MRRTLGLLLAALLLAHLAAGPGSFHDDSGRTDPTMFSVVLTQTSPSESTFVGCLDLGTCARADVPEPPWLPGTSLGLVIIAIALVVLRRRWTGRDPLWRVGPSPPPHLSSQVVLLI